ncbi:hypothetical protein QVD17_30764 [Tagetes erecta]|uniref:Uncharacterized protein n=1 Tax=Tagetes erecta TaxID=13708 RepID=A0AAD8K238_TARER|nr:hypothetical protein QVD17_30764 [Tagetes erecta]
MYLPADDNLCPLSRVHQEYQSKEVIPFSEVLSIVAPISSFPLQHDNIRFDALISSLKQFEVLFVVLFDDLRNSLEKESWRTIAHGLN